MKIQSYATDFFTKGHERTLLAKKNIAGVFLFKGGSVVISLLLIPLILDYISPSQFGIWLTISSFLAWFAFFDIGLGNGLKNKLAEAIAAGDLPLARIYVSTTYFIITLISMVLLLLFLLLNFFLDWTRLLNAPLNLAQELSTIVLVVFSLFAVQFVLQLINVVTAARQNMVITSLIGFLGNLLSLIVIFILNKTTAGSLLNLALASTIIPLFILLLFNIQLFSGSYREFAPALKFVKLPYIKDLLGLGIKFFIIQIGLLFLYNTANLVIIHVISPEAVTSFNIAFKYFSILTMICGIVMAPFWTAVTEAHAKGDIPWIRRTVHHLMKFCMALFFAGLLMLLLANFVYSFWVGPEIHIPFSLSFLLFVFTVINTYRSVYSFYFNGTGKIMLQLYLISVSGLVNIPFSIFLGKLMGTSGVILATTILCAFCAVVETIQYQKLINKQATGIWNK
ncbi:MATE family efflux transporter [Pedobacter immunditicola]|uniref:MATE family efflux transporter n=1 Tax=Pedobacter immunditicola TaxID=3133440 RepID=UPI0030B21B2E